MVWDIYLDVSIEYITTSSYSSFRVITNCNVWTNMHTHTSFTLTCLYNRYWTREWWCKIRNNSTSMCMKINQLSIWVIKRERIRKRQIAEKKKRKMHRHSLDTRWMKLRKDQQSVVLWICIELKNVMLIRCVNNKYLSISSLTRCY